MADPGQQRRGRRFADNRAQPLGGLVRRRDDPVGEHRARVADPGAGRRHRDAGDPAPFQRGEPTDPGAIHPDPGIVESGGEAFGAQRHRRVTAVDAATRALITSIRAGGGPRFLHARTYRLTGHTGVDAAPYRPAAELEARLLEEPILRAADLLLAAGVGEAELLGDRQAAEAEMTAAYAAARGAAFPDAAEAFLDVQDVGSPLLGAF